MSQQLIPLNGGVQTIQTSTTVRRVNVLSSQSIKVKRLENRPTEWDRTGRPIYRRLPAVGETYQINFFDILPAVNTAVRLDETRDVGYVYVPWGEGIFGPVSMEAVSSESREDLIIKSGQVVWKYGTTFVPPAILNLREIDFGSGRYLVAYQLVYDDAPRENYYKVEDYSLAGTKLVITSSSDSVLGWRYSAINCFLNSDTYWSNSDTYFPTYAQPASAFIQWESNEVFQSSPTAPTIVLPSAYSKVVLRCPSGTSFTGTAILSYVDSAGVAEVSQTSVSSDSGGQLFEFTITSPSLQTGWRVDFSDINVKIQSVTVSGVVSKVTKPVAPSTRCALSMYPADSVPSTIVNSEGETVPATYCNIAYIDVDSNYRLQDIQDIRQVIHREYKPVADWLTMPFDEDLTSLYQQVKGYASLWMSPQICVRQEYLGLETYGVELVQ